MANARSHALACPLLPIAGDLLLNVMPLNVLLLDPLFRRLIHRQ
jgi:hypothetical protein